MIRFLKLRNGQWGAKVFGSDCELVERARDTGEPVMVRTKDGGLIERKISRILWRGKTKKGKPALLVALVVRMGTRRLKSREEIVETNMCPVCAEDRCPSCGQCGCRHPEEMEWRCSDLWHGGRIF